MKLALSMLCDELEHQHPGILADPVEAYGRPRASHSVTLAPPHRCVSGVRLFDGTNAPDALDPALLYMVEDPVSAPLVSAHANIMMVNDGLHEHPSHVSSKQRSNEYLTIAITSGVKVHELMDEVLEVFERYQAWHDAFNAAIIDNVPLDELLAVGCSLFRNPVSFTNPALENVTRAGAEPPDDLAGSILETVLQIGYSPFEIFGDEERDRLVLEIENAHAPYLSVPQRAYADNCFLIAPIQDGNRLPPALTSTDICEPFTEGQVELISLIASGVEAYLRLNSEQSQTLNELALIVETMLRGFPVNEERMLHGLKRYRWNVDDEFIVAVILDEETPYIDAIYARASKEINEGLALIFEGQIVVVMNRTRSEDPDAIERFAEMLSHMDLCGGMSSVESGFTNIGRLYAQAKVAMGAASTEGISGLVHFDEDYERCIVTLLKQQVDLSVLMHPAVFALSALDKGAVLIKTLGCFLLHGRNLSRTAQDLFVHRSTLAYRLDKIESETGIDLKELSDDDAQAILTSCMIARNL